MRRIPWIALAGIAFLFLVSGCRLGNVQLTVLQTSDVHNHASGYGPFHDYTPLDTADNDSVKGGYARLAALINGIRREQAEKCIPTLVFDSGDFLMGTVYDMTADNPIAMKFFSLAQYDAVTLGNHEFDWSSAGLAQLLGSAAAQGFKVPVVASNTVIPAGNPLQALKDSGTIVNEKIFEYPHGLKVGVLGLMGEDADMKAPVAKPVTFDHDYALIQGKVDFMRKRGVDLVIVLSHGGVENSGAGDDAKLAQNVKGIDVIASGHYHTATAAAVTPEGTDTVIFSPGEYGEFLSRLDITYNVLLGKVVDYKLSLIPVDDGVKGDAQTQAVVEAYHAALNASLAPLGVALGDAVSFTGFDLGLKPFQASSLGTLAADSVRAVASSLAPLNGGRVCDISVVASGVIRDPIQEGNTGVVTFADVYNVLPLGISPYATTPLGYPLMSVYVKAADVYKICSAGMVVAPMIGGDFYLNFSGIRIDYNEATYAVDGVYLCDPGDVLCLGPGTFMNPFDTETLYHCVVDLYALQMMGALAQFGIVITPLDIAGNPIDPAAYVNHRIDRDIASGTQELKEWMALLSYLTSGAFPAGIPELYYGETGLALSRVF